MTAILLTKCIVCLMVAFCSTHALARGTFNMKYLERRGNKGSRSAYVSNSEDEWFTQRLDHFQPTNSLTWKQRYWVRNDLHEQGGPVFLILCGEGPCSGKGLRSGFWTKLAKIYHALMFSLEHRFYGKSHPLSDMSVDNLRYLSSQQALADAANFIDAMNQEHKIQQTTKWIVFGMSYAGSLAAWLRNKYSHLVYGAIASSAPVLARLDFPEYYDVVQASLSTHGDTCVAAVRKTSNELKRLLSRTEPEKNITQALQLCDPLNVADSFEVAAFFTSLSEEIATATQYHNIDTTMKKVCDILVNTSVGGPLDRINALLKNKFDNTCKDVSYHRRLKPFKNITFSADNGQSSAARQWTYQTCTEFGYFQTSQTQHALMGETIPLQFFIKMCADLFGEKFTRDYMQKAVDHTNMVYGGLGLGATRVIYVHGSIDPWHVLGITKTKIPESPAIFINGSSHGADTHGNPDSPNVQAAQEEVSRIIREWLR